MSRMTLVVQKAVLCNLSRMPFLIQANQPYNSNKMVQSAVSVTLSIFLPSGGFRQGDGQPVSEVLIIMSQTLENCSSSSIELPLLQLNMIECSSVPMTSTSSCHDIRNTRLLDCGTSLRLCKQLFNVRYETGYDVPLLKYRRSPIGPCFRCSQFPMKSH